MVCAMARPMLPPKDRDADRGGAAQWHVLPQAILGIARHDVELPLHMHEFMGGEAGHLQRLFGIAHTADRDPVRAPRMRQKPINPGAHCHDEFQVGISGKIPWTRLPAERDLDGLGFGDPVGRAHLDQWVRMGRKRRAVVPREVMRGGQVDTLSNILIHRDILLLALGGVIGWRASRFHHVPVGKAVQPGGQWSRMEVPKIGTPG